MRAIRHNLLFLTALAAIVPCHLEGIDADLARFAASKRDQIREFARALTNPVPSMVWSFFDAVKEDDWDTATNLEARLDRASGRYAAPHADQPPSPALGTIIWPPISETIGAYRDFHDWDPKWLHRFGREIIDSIPRGSIYFGGTDPGRFVISALSESHREGKPFFTLTQNQLADRTYLEYLQKMYGSRIYVPSADDSTKVFNQYLTNAQQRLESGKLKPGEDVRIVNDRVQVSGQVAVMEINGMLAHLIFEKNSDHEFYVEESFPLDWMYPCLSPHGLILRLNAKPLPVLSIQAVQTDQAYWKKLTGELIGDWITSQTTVTEICDFANKVFLRKDLAGFKGDGGFGKNEEAQKTFSKLRSSIGGLYAWRADHAVEADEKKRMQDAAELTFRQAYAMCPYSPEALFRYVNLLISLRKTSDAFLIAKTSLRLAPDDKQFQDLTRRLREYQ